MLQSYNFFRIDTYKTMGLASRFPITTIPSIVIVKDGKVDEIMCNDICKEKNSCKFKCINKYEGKEMKIVKKILLFIMVAFMILPIVGCSKRDFGPTGEFIVTAKQAVKMIENKDAIFD